MLPSNNLINQKCNGCTFLFGLLGKLSNNLLSEKLQISLPLSLSLTFFHNSFHRLFTCTVHVACKCGELNKIPIIYCRLHLGFCHEIVSFPILLSSPWRPDTRFYIFWLIKTVGTWWYETRWIRKCCCIASSSCPGEWTSQLRRVHIAPAELDLTLSIWICV